MLHRLGAFLRFVASLGGKAGVWLLGAATFAGYLAFWQPQFELFVHFRHVYAGAASILALLLVAERPPRRWIFGAVFLLVFNGLHVLPWHMGGRAGECETGEPFRVMATNVLTSNTDYAAIRRAIAQYDPQILLINEYSTGLDRALDQTFRGFQEAFTLPRRDNFGIALFSEFPAKKITPRRLGQFDLPQVRATFHVDGRELAFWGVHPLPPVKASQTTDRDAILERIGNDVRETEAPTILAGDLNTTMWTSVYRVLEWSGLQNARRGWGITGTLPAQLPVRIPIDHIMHTGQLKACNFEIGPRIGSDHLPVVADLVFSEDESPDTLSSAASSSGD